MAYIYPIIENSIVYSSTGVVYCCTSALLYCNMQQLCNIHIFQAVQWAVDQAMSLEEFAALAASPLPPDNNSTVPHDPDPLCAEKSAGGEGSADKIQSSSPKPTISNSR